MKYITGIHALNIEDSTNACRDWHTSALNWKTIRLIESDNTLFKDWGIEKDKKIPDNDGLYNVANTLRAIVDLMSTGNIGYLKGFRDDFLCTDEYNKELFEKVALLKDSEHWNDIHKLMKCEFMWEWDNYISEFSI